jgi:orotidine-5'-phosphate decarboxylase
VPGIGAQGGDLEATLEAGLDAAGTGLLINSSRAIIYAGAGQGTGSADAIRAAAQTLARSINAKRAAAR